MKKQVIRCLGLPNGVPKHILKVPSKRRKPMTRWGFFKARKSGAALPELGEKDAPELEESEMPAESTAKSREKKNSSCYKVGRFDPPIR